MSNGGPVVVMGSSIFQQWFNVQDLLPYKATINLAVGGTTTLDWVDWIAPQVLPLKLSIVLFYAGSNDINRPYPVADILSRTHQMLNQIHEAIPDCKVHYFSVIRAPQKQPVWDQVDQINETMQQNAAKQDWLTFVDLNPIFYDDQGSCLE
ncbi:MAG TPA: hypothetical protein DER01_19195, partial [Phycisphaerales bacterium]|nr:hypothetical protein [Phycisphaerales bacterium]